MIIAAVAIPLTVTVASVLVVVKIASAPEPEVDVEPPTPGRIARYRALLVDEAGPGGAGLVDYLAAPAGRVTLTVHELVWEPDDDADPSWRAYLPDVRLIDRPGSGSGCLVVEAGDRTVRFVIDEETSSGRLGGRWLADRRNARAAAWLACLIDAATSRAHASMALIRQAQLAGWAPSATAKLVEGDGRCDAHVQAVGRTRHRYADPTVGSRHRCVR